MEKTAKIKKVTALQVAKAALKVAEKKPENKNPLGKSSQCFHFYDDGQPGCIFGHALHGLNITAKQVKNHTTILDLGLAFSWNERDSARLSKVQRKADRMEKWGTLVPDIKEAIELIGQDINE